MVKTPFQIFAVLHLKFKSVNEFTKVSNLALELNYNVWHTVGFTIKQPGFER
jgi:hypothetical protein